MSNIADPRRDHAGTGGGGTPNKSNPRKNPRKIQGRQGRRRFGGGGRLAGAEEEENEQGSGERQRDPARRGEGPHQSPASGVGVTTESYGGQGIILYQV